MSRELELSEVVFEDELEEVKVLIFGADYQDEDGNYYCVNNTYRNNKDVEEIEVIFYSGGTDEYLFMEHIFKYKDKLYSIMKNENSFGNRGFEHDTLKQVFPKQKMVTYYE